TSIVHSSLAFVECSELVQMDASATRSTIRTTMPIQVSGPSMSMCLRRVRAASRAEATKRNLAARARSEEHTSELQSRENLVCRLLLEKKKLKMRHNV